MQKAWQYQKLLKVCFFLDEIRKIETSNNHKKNNDDKNHNNNNANCSDSNYNDDNNDMEFNFKLQFLFTEKYSYNINNLQRVNSFKKKAH